MRRIITAPVSQRPLSNRLFTSNLTSIVSETDSLFRWRDHSKNLLKTSFSRRIQFCKAPNIPAHHGQYWMCVVVLKFLISEFCKQHRWLFIKKVLAALSHRDGQDTSMHSLSPSLLSHPLPRQDETFCQPPVVKFCNNRNASRCIYSIVKQDLRYLGLLSGAYCCLC